MKRQFTDNFNCYQIQEVPVSSRPDEDGQNRTRLGGVQSRDLLAAQRLEAAGRLAAWVAHQINNPLGAISGNAQLLARRLQRDIRDPELLQDYLRYIEGIQSQTERCARITGEMLNFTRPGEPDLRAVDLSGLIRDAIELVGYAYPGCEIECDSDEWSDLPKASADSDWLIRMLFELLSNAVQASDRTPVFVSMQITSAGRVEIEIRDFGSGIDDGILLRIFDPFFSTREKSRGLGLTLCLEMSRKMGGDLRVAETSESGSVFVASLPVWGQRD
jgi:signal transduction histidine kinase